MRRAHSLIVAVAVCLPLAGCYYDPDYGYVRNGTGADAYYGVETTTVVSPGYGYYNYGPACCYSGYGYSSFGASTIFYDGGYNRGYYDRGYRGYRGSYGRDWHGRPPPRGNWQGRPGDNRGDWRGNNRPPGGWRGGGRPGNDGDHGPPRGNWQGGNRPSRGNSQGDRPPRGSNQGVNRPQGGWQGGGRGDNRPQSSATPRSAPQRSAPSPRQFGNGRDRSRFRSNTD